MRRAWIAAGMLAGFVLLAARAEAQAGEAGAQPGAQPGALPGIQSLAVQYMEGNAAQRTGGAWSALSIGDQLPLDASVKLERFALVQLKAPGSSITLTQPGTYVLRDVVAAGASLRSAGAVEAAAVAFSRVLRGTGKPVNAVGGVRSEVMPREDFGIDSAGAGPAESPPSDTAPAVTPAGATIRMARDLIAMEHYQEAIDQLRDAVPITASPDEGREASFYLASAYELAGDARSALAALNAASPKSSDEWAPDSVLLGARLLEDTFAWAQARDLLLKAGTSLRYDEERAATFLFLLAVAYRGTGEKELQDAVLERIVSMDPTSDLALAAARLQATP